MPSVNKAIVMGNLGADPDIRYLENGTPIATISLATNETWKDKQTGEKKSHTTWHRIILWNRLAELAREYLSKGDSIYIEGKFVNRQWTGEDGITRYGTEIKGNIMQFVTTKQRNNNDGTQPMGDRHQQDFDDDIPF
jgi:single-strand DNA-binding protein